MYAGEVVEGEGAVLAEETFGQRLKRLRDAAGISQAELARRTDLHYSLVSKMESGAAGVPRGDRLERLARALDATSEYLLTGDCPEDELPADLQAMYRLLSPEERRVIDELVAQRHKLPDTEEGRAAFREAIRVAILYLRGRLSDLEGNP